RGNIRIGDRRGNAEAGLPGADHLVGGGSSNSRTTRRMRMVAGRKGGSADGMMDDGEAGTGTAMDGRGSHGLSQCHSGAAERPGGQGDAGADYRPARRCRWSSVPEPILGRRVHQWTHHTGWDIRSVRHGPGGCRLWDAAKRLGGQGEHGPDRPARWRRRLVFNSPDRPGLV
ncbi:hypothetical protein DFH09DRAFT_1154798, partial [Mycena vulgaris]